jgi:hypothetical protein
VTDNIPDTGRAMSGGDAVARSAPKSPIQTLSQDDWVRRFTSSAPNEKDEADLVQQINDESEPCGF